MGRIQRPISLRIGVLSAQECRPRELPSSFAGVSCLRYLVHIFLRRSPQRQNFVSAPRSRGLCPLDRSARGFNSTTLDTERTVGTPARAQPHWHLRRLARGPLEFCRGGGHLRKFAHPRCPCCSPLRATHCCFSGPAPCNPLPWHTRTPQSRRRAPPCRSGSEHTARIPRSEPCTARPPCACRSHPPRPLTTSSSPPAPSVCRPPAPRRCGPR